ncbi:hypothetical protein BGAL_0078g00240 [Botrytis galanthina]|uniref:Uncharacterized protein n=1 Tax=Botrytis galanthina TaxID=278940 RepID=A0A4S8R856_9HELO|nr:hypothetical protein BGAL_0078g00240 [Botrytis galanthina]
MQGRCSAHQEQLSTSELQSRQEFTRQPLEPSQQIDGLTSLRPHESPPSQMRSPDPRTRSPKTYQTPELQRNENSGRQGQSWSSSRQVINRGSSAPYQSSRENLNRPYKPVKRGSSNQVREQQNRKRDVQREPRSLAREPVSKERNLDWMAERKNWKPTSGEN